jgi:hypothetical protein
MSKGFYAGIYEIISGLKVNFYKSSLIGINLDENFTSRIARGIFCCNDHFPVMFIGLPLGANPSRLSTWKPVLASIQGKLGSWKGSLLSMAGRICLIKSVFSSLPLFYMFVFLMPQGIIKTISERSWRIGAPFSTREKLGFDGPVYLAP